MRLFRAAIVAILLIGGAVLGVSRSYEASAPPRVRAREALHKYNTERLRAIYECAEYGNAVEWGGARIDPQVVSGCLELMPPDEPGDLPDSPRAKPAPPSSIEL